ncbi:type II secretory pathway predicted ATPase ExeA [Geothermobacter ehrlichii]|uniref:Type II secretory pathway predicted ATPase ExeA n=1 Tax=Geothermobacter ehrlichii TaxID=213224 RepID=A0A5D3WNB3_9BACT|nr:AAA family ATPase [Geothermobacter ehrlichii]TYP00341.1 type II secretory pathway predicted ATPase ExeA [Geothermobacter ehrlichii]
MYREHFGFREQPFSIAPDPQYLYLSRQHREALAHLIYGVRTGGFVLLTGEVGTGKTTLCRCLLEQLPAQVLVAYIVNTGLSERELLETICDEFRIVRPRQNVNNKVLIDAINTFLLKAHAAGKSPVLIIDEAQNLAPSVLEQVRLLTNLETSRRKLLQIILIGQPELKSLLETRQMRQLSQRITARFHLEALSGSEIAAYVNHRLHKAGVTRPIFGREALRLLGRLSGGIPRLINVICDRALLGAYCEEKHTVSRRILRKAAAEVFGRPVGILSRWWPVLFFAACLLFAVLYGSGLFARLPFTGFFAAGPSLSTRS